MLLFKKVDTLQQYLIQQKKEGKNIGFVPTMGALHAGHLSLLNAAKTENDLSVVSIFVNPTQFNEASDLEKYPRTEGADIEKLTLAGCAVLFMPSITEIYPDGTQNTTESEFNFGNLANVMEGAERPGHFAGVVQIVKRLLEIVEPDRLYMGQKDYQQFAIIQEMLVQWEAPIEIIRCPIIREPDGLAMSSRNVRLSPDHRKRATLLSQLLTEAKERSASETPAETEAYALKRMREEPDFKPEYFTISDGRTLQPLENYADAATVVICLACWVGDVRLIDNVVF